MKKIVMIMVALLALKSQAQTQHEIYPEPRTNLCFYSGLMSAVTYTVTYAAFNQDANKRNHLKPTLITAGVSLLTTAMVYQFNKSNQVNKRQDATAWLAPCVVSITLLRIGLN